MKKFSSFLFISSFILILAACGKPIDQTVVYHHKNGLDYVVHAKQEDEQLVFTAQIENKTKKTLDITHGSGTLRIKNENTVTPDTIILVAYKKTLKPNESFETNVVTIPYDKKMKKVDVIIDVMFDKKIYKTTYKMTLQEK